VGTSRAPDLVSVIMPARNAAATIEQQLAALARQNYDGPWEVVVVDNGSTDSTAAVVRRWSDRLPGLRVVDASGRPDVSHARNAGVASSSGDFLAFCDADDVVSPGWLAALVAAGSESDMVGGNLELGTLNDATVRAWAGWVSPDDRLPLYLRFLPAAYGGNCAIWRTVLERVTGWNDAYAGVEDTELSWRVQLAGYGLAFAGPGAAVHYRLRSNLRVLWRKSYREGKTEVRLFREFRAHGVPRTDARHALRNWAGLVRRTTELVRSRARRGRYLRVLGIQTGRLVGSIRSRTLYL
jgi:glycosyltransferase involved in cell wall biosynthesis